MHDLYQLIFILIWSWDIDLNNKWLLPQQCDVERQVLAWNDYIFSSTLTQDGKECPLLKEAARLLSLVSGELEKLSLWPPHRHVQVTSLAKWAQAHRHAHAKTHRYNIVWTLLAPRVLRSLFRLHAELTLTGVEIIFAFNRMFSLNKSNVSKQRKYKQPLWLLLTDVCS